MYAGKKTQKLTLPTLIMPPEGSKTIWWASYATWLNTHADSFIRLFPIRNLFKAHTKNN